MTKNEKLFIAFVLLLAILSRVDSYLGIISTFTGVLLGCMYLCDLIKFKGNED